MPTSTITVDVHLSDEEWAAAMVDDCRVGLSSSPKHLSPVWFYDARGSELFDDITRLPEYYPTRAERSLLEAHALSIVESAGADTLVELGSGTSDKTRALLDAMAQRDQLDTYVPFDVSERTVREAADTLVDRYPTLSVHAVIGDFRRHLGCIPDSGRRLVAFLGGTIGNLTPPERATFLHDLRSTMDGHDRLLLGVDLVKEPGVLVRAYDDAAGVTADFNRNALRHVNHRLGGDFDPIAFEHVAVWNEQESWIEMHLRSTSEQAVRLEALDLDISFRREELIRTEISAKFTPEGIADELARAGFRTDHTWCADEGFLLLTATPC